MDPGMRVAWHGAVFILVFALALVIGMLYVDHQYNMQQWRIMHPAVHYHVQHD